MFPGTQANGGWGQPESRTGPGCHATSGSLPGLGEQGNSAVLPLHEAHQLRTLPVSPQGPGVTSPTAVLSVVQSPDQGCVASVCDWGGPGPCLRGHQPKTGRAGIRDAWENPPADWEGGDSRIKG